MDAPIEGVLIDLYGTLVPAAARVSLAPHLHEMARLLGADPLRFERDWAQSRDERMLGSLGSIEETIATIAERQDVRPTSDNIVEATQVRLAFSRHTLDSCGPVLSELDALSAVGLRLAVVSDCSGETARLWPTTLLGRRIKVTVFSCNEGFYKPDPRMYRLGLHRLGLSADRCAYVGDGGSRELTGAKEVGLPAYLYKFPGDEGQPDIRYDPDTGWTGTKLKDLRDLLSPSR